MISVEDLTKHPVLDDKVYLSEVEARRIADWLNSVFDDEDAVVPAYAVGMALCSETFFLDSGRELTTAEIDRVLDAVRFGTR